MRIAIVNWSARKFGGAEAYLDLIMSELPRAAHDVALLCESDVPADRPKIFMPPGAPLWCIATLGAKAALEAFARWRPDVIYAGGMIAEEIEAELFPIAGGVLRAYLQRHLYQHVESPHASRATPLQPALGPAMPTPLLSASMRRLESTDNAQ
jgi:hypothetical protein